MKEKISIILGAFVGGLSYLLGGFDSLLTAFVTILIVDTITGMLKALSLGKYQSSKFRKGFVKKSGYLLGIILSVQIDILLNSNGTLRDAVLTFFIVNESFSIIENLGTMGVKFPTIVINALESLNKDENMDDEQ